MRNYRNFRVLAVSLASLCFAISYAIFTTLDVTNHANTAISTGTGTAWSNPTNVYASDDNYATVDGKNPTQKLWCTNFGFSIPTDATIVGIQVLNEGHSPSPHPSVGEGNYYDYRLIKGGSETGDLKGAGDLHGGSDATTTVPAATNDLWSVSLSPSDVNSSNFGAYYMLSWYSAVSDTEAVDQFNIKVYYNPAPNSNVVLCQERSAKVLQARP